ncbi:MAG: serine/threonine-protein kinase [Kofleriaceae bacterium]
MGKGPLIAGAVLLVAGGAALGFGLTRKAVGGMTPGMTSAMGAAVANLDGDIKAARASVEQRAKTLSEINTVRAAIGTDAATMRDQVGKEIAFNTDGGEVIELGQLPKAGGAPIVLVTLPDSGMRSMFASKMGAFAELAGDKLLVTRTSEIVPSDEELAKTVTGYVTVTKPLDLAPALDKLAAAGLSGRIVVGEKTKTFGNPPSDAETKWKTEPIPSQPDAQLIAAEPPAKAGMPIAVIGGGAGIAGLGLILILIGLLTGKDKTGLTQAMAAQTPTNVGIASTQLSTGVAVGTPTAQTPVPIELPGGHALDPANIGPGTQIGRWQVIRRLGSGGMADVYLCRAKGEAGFEKTVALKLMHQHLARNQRAVDHFLDEARLAAKISHPNVVAIQDLGKIGADYCIVMEYVEGVDLERLLMSSRDGGRQVPVNVGLAILCKMLDGLNGAHTASGPDGVPMGIIHRDVKAANVLVSKQGGVKVVDFGIAKAAVQGHLTVAGETKGTPSMMAPEQRVGEKVDVRADVYSAGAVAFEVLTGHAVNLDLAALAHLGVEKWPHLPPPSSLRPELPLQLDKIVLTSMAFERERRPANCADFEALLEGVMKQNNLTATDKEIARWAESEMRMLGVELSGTMTGATPVTSV